MTQRMQFKTIADLHAVPDAKVDALCEDLRMWLHLCRRVEGAPGIIARDTDTFKWVDDGEHNAYLRATMDQQ